MQHLVCPQKATDDVLRWERKIGHESIPAVWLDLLVLGLAELVERSDQDTDTELLLPEKLELK